MTSQTICFHFVTFTSTLEYISKLRTTLFTDLFESGLKYFNGGIPSYKFPLRNFGCKLDVVISKSMCLKIIFGVQI